MKFELIPNEILMECFAYLSASELFYAFDRLNYRFYQLIRNIQLHLDFHNVRKSMFDRFCKKMLSEPEIKNQIYSMHLSNKYTHDQIEKFLSLFSIDQFLHLRSLTLTQLDFENGRKLESMVSSISTLDSFHLFDSIEMDNDEFISLVASKVRTISVDTLVVFPEWVQRYDSIINLTLSSSEVFDLCQIMTEMPMLQYLHVKYCRCMFKSYKRQTCYKPFYAAHLKQLIFDRFEFGFGVLEMLLHGTPHLKSLTISSDPYWETMMDAIQWEHLISTSLHDLKIFNFRFEHDRDNIEGDFISIFEAFQNDFWHKQHHWYTDYLLTKHSLFIYTKSYTFSMYELNAISNGDIYINSKRFDNLTELTLFQQAMEQKCRYYFRKIISFELKGPLNEEISLKTKQINILTKMLSLWNLKELKISSKFKLESSSVLLCILREAPQLSSITMDQKMLISLLNDHELCKYLNKTVKKLVLSYDPSYSPKVFDNYGELRIFCKTFSNVEILQCYVDKKTEFLFMLNELSKLLHITAFIKISEDPKKVKLWINNELTKLNVNYIIEKHLWHHDKTRVIVHIWMG